MDQPARCHVPDALRRVHKAVTTAEKAMAHAFAKRAMTVRPAPTRRSSTPRSGVCVKGLVGALQASGRGWYVATIQGLEHSWRILNAREKSPWNVRRALRLFAAAPSHRGSTTATTSRLCNAAHIFRTAKSATLFATLAMLELESTSVSPPGMCSGQFACQLEKLHRKR